MIEENPYYGVQAISNSSLKNISPTEGGHPIKYKAFLSGDSEKFNSLSLDRGKLLHKWVENSDAFEVSDIESPSDMVIKWVELVINSERNWETQYSRIPNKDEKDIIIVQSKKYLKIYNNYKDEVKIVELFHSFSDYYNFIKYPSDKIALTKATKDILFGCYQSLYSHPIANKLLFKQLEDCTVLNEQAIYFKFLEENCKSLLDRVIIDEQNKCIKIIDLKTTSKPIGNYPNEFVYYRTYRQLAFYGKAIIELLKQLDYKDIEEYEISYHIVAVETIGLFITQVFDIDKAWIDQGTIEYTDLISLIKWHTTKEVWNITKDEFIGNNKLEYNTFKYLKNQ